LNVDKITRNFGLCRATPVQISPRMWGIFICLSLFMQIPSGRQQLERHTFLSSAPVFLQHCKYSFIPA